MHVKTELVALRSVGTVEVPHSIRSNPSARVFSLTLRKLFASSIAVSLRL